MTRDIWPLSQTLMGLSFFASDLRRQARTWNVGTLSFPLVFEAIPFL
jgi:hypothetical protein